MSEHQWVRVTTCDSIPVREGRAVTVAGQELALFNLSGRYLATANRCPHRGGPLCDGIVSGSSVVCPLHAWKVNLETGDVERPAQGAGQCIRTFPTRIEDGIVVVGLPVNRGRESFKGDSLSGTCRTEHAPSSTSPEANQGASRGNHRDTSVDTAAPVAMRVGVSSLNDSRPHFQGS